LAFGEHVPAVDESVFSSTHYGRSIGIISALLAQRCANSDILLSEPTIYLSHAQSLGAKQSSHSSFIYDVFLSYPGSQKVFAKAISSAIQQEGLSVFFDENEVDVGQKSAERIDLGLNQSNHLVAVCEERMGLWQQAEISYFFSKRSEHGARLLPVLMPSVQICKIPWFLQQYSVSRVDNQTDPSGLGKELASSLRKRKSL
jgi:TIR domain